MDLTGQSDKNKLSIRDDANIITVGELRDIIKQAVDSAMINHCRFDGVDENDLKKIIKATKAIGDGDFEEGIITIKANHRLLLVFKKNRDALAVKIANIILVATAGGLATAVWLGIKQLMKMEN